MSGYTELTDASKNVYKNLGNIYVGAVHYAKDISVENKIIVYKELSKFLNSKLNAEKAACFHFHEIGKRKLSSTNSEHNDVLFNLTKQKLKEDPIHLAIMNVVFSEVLLNSSSHPTYEVYREKVLEQMKYLKSTSDKIKEIHATHKIVVEEMLKLKKKLLVDQSQYSDHLLEQKTRIEAERQQKLDATYKEQLAAVNARIMKINFMRILINRLLTFSKLDLGDNSNLLEILAKTRTPCTLESVLK